MRECWFTELVICPQKYLLYSHVSPIDLINLISKKYVNLTKIFLDLLTFFL